MRRLTLTVVALAPLAAILLEARGQLVAALLVFFGGGAVLMIPVLRPNVQWLGPVITHFATDSRELWLTIDDGPTPDTAELLRLLADLQVPATFFVKGSLAEPDLIQTILANGHTVANHTHTHPSGFFWCLPPHAIASQIDRCAARIPPTPLFRAPVGMKNPFVHPLLAKRAMKLIGFSARAFDAVVRDPDVIAGMIERKLEPGAIVVLHQGRAWSLAAISQTVARARARGYSFTIPSFDRLKTKR